MNVATPAGGDSVAARGWPGVLDALLTGQDLTAEDTAWAMDRIMRGEATDAQIAGFMSRCGPRGRRSRRSTASYGPCTRTPT